MTTLNNQQSQQGVTKTLVQSVHTATGSLEYAVLAYLEESKSWKLLRVEETGQEAVDYIVFNYPGTPTLFAILPEYYSEEECKPAGHLPGEGRLPAQCGGWWLGGDGQVWQWRADGFVIPPHLLRLMVKYFKTGRL